MIFIFIGPPYSGKEIQAEILGEKTKLPVFGMGKLIREAYKAGDPKAVKGFENYSMKGLHLPVYLKFDLLKEKMDSTKNGFILDNFPANEEDLGAFLSYVKNPKKVNRVFYINVSKEEMLKRMIQRGRQDDKPDVVMKRRKHQDKERIPVIEFFKKQGLLEEINGDKSIEEVSKEIFQRLEL